MTCNVINANKENQDKPTEERERVREKWIITGSKTYKVRSTNEAKNQGNNYPKKEKMNKEQTIKRTRLPRHYYSMFLSIRLQHERCNVAQRRYYSVHILISLSRHVRQEQYCFCTIYRRLFCCSFSVFYFISIWLFYASSFPPLLPLSLSLYSFQFHQTLQTIFSTQTEQKEKKTEYVRSLNKIDLFALGCCCCQICVHDEANERRLTSNSCMI